MVALNLIRYKEQQLKTEIEKANLPFSNKAPSKNTANKSASATASRGHPLMISGYHAVARGVS